MKYNWLPHVQLISLPFNKVQEISNKTLQALNAINYLDTRTKLQLTLEGIHDRLEIISQARKYVIKDFMVNNIFAKANFMLGKIADLKLLFKDIFRHGLPNFWNEQGLFLSEEEYHIKLSKRKNDTSKVDNIMKNIKGQDIFDVLDKDFYLLHETRK